MFKLIPHCAKGSWVVSQSVGTTPVILGRKLATSYHTNDRCGRPRVCSLLRVSGLAWGCMAVCCSAVAVVRGNAFDNFLGPSCW